MPISLPVATLIAGAVGGGASAYGSHVAGKANTTAAKQQADATAAQLQFQREQEATRKAEYDQQQAAAKAAWDAEQARKAPYRQAAQNAMVKLSQMAGLPKPTVDLTTPPSATPPPGWTPGGSTGGSTTLPMSALMPTGGGQTDALVASAMNDPRRVALGLETAIPGREDGGPVEQNRPYIVGESGPELFTPETTGRITPALGQPSMNAGDVTQAYQQAFGRAPDARELASELENANKYSKSGILDQIARRTSNDPGSGDYGVADWSKVAGGQSSSADSGGPVITLPPGGTGGTPRPQAAPVQEAPDPTLPIGTLIPQAAPGVPTNPASVAPGPYDQAWWRRYRQQVVGAV